MADSEDSTLGTLAKLSAWLKENRAIAIPVAAAVLGLGVASVGRRREVRRSYVEGFESGWEASERRHETPVFNEHEEIEEE